MGEFSREVPPFVIPFRRFAVESDPMLTTVLWWTGPVLEFALIVRALQQGLFLRYPTFFSYLTWVALADCLRNYVYNHHYSSYSSVYWPSQIISLILGYGVILEILHVNLARHPGAARMARYLVVIIFAAIFAYVGFRALTSPQWSPGSTNAELERDLRAAQIAILAGVLGVIAYFRIPLGKNSKGLICGYGLFLGTSVMTLALHSYAGSSFDYAWLILQPFLYLVCLLTWTFTMWSYHPNPAPVFDDEVGNYTAYAASSRAAMESVRSNLSKVVRP